MKLRELGWGIALAMLPLSPFFLPKSLDLWHAAGLWMQVSILLLFCSAIASRAFRVIPNLPLALWLGWVGVQTLWLWNEMVMKYSGYPLTMLLPIAHILLLVMFYLAATSTWDAQLIWKISRWLAYSGLFVIAYATAQALGLDQFFNDGGSARNVKLVGTVGNNTHFAAQLTMLLPIFLMQGTRRWALAAAWTMLLIILTKSVTGIAISWFIVTLWAAQYSWLSAGILAACGLTIGAVCTFSYPHFLSPTGRIAVWSAFWDILMQKPITGHGTGYVYELSKVTPPGHVLYHWRHVHNEFLQFWIEQGLIGISLLIWGITSLLLRALRNIDRVMVLPLGLILVAFTLFSLTGYPAHLWQLGILPLFAYCGLLILLERA